MPAIGLNSFDGGNKGLKRFSRKDIQQLMTLTDIRSVTWLTMDVLEMLSPICGRSYFDEFSARNSAFALCWKAL